MAKKKKGPAAKGPAKNGEGDTAEPTNAVTSDGGGAVPSSSGSVGSRGSSYVSFRGPRIFAKKGEYIPGACAREEAAHREEDAEHEAALGDWHHAASNWEAAAKGWAFYSTYGFSSSETEREARAHGEAGKCEFYNANYALATEFFRNQLSCARESSLSREQSVAKALQNLGMASFYMGNTAQAISNLNEAAETLRSVEAPSRSDRSQLRGVVAATGVVYQTCGDYRSALATNQQDLDMSTDDNDSLGKYRALTNVGICHLGQGNNDLALESFEGALKLARDVAADPEALGDDYFDTKAILELCPIGGAQNGDELTWRALFHVALASFRLGDLEKALTCISEAEAFVKDGKITQLFKVDKPDEDGEAENEEGVAKEEEPQEGDGGEDGAGADDGEKEEEDADEEAPIQQAEVNGPPPEVDANTNAMLRSQMLAMCALCHANKKRTIDGDAPNQPSVYADPNMEKARDDMKEALKALTTSPAPCDLNRAEALKIYGEVLLALGSSRAGAKNLEDALTKLVATMPLPGSRAPKRKKAGSADKDPKDAKAAEAEKKKVKPKAKAIPEHAPNMQLMQQGTLQQDKKNMDKAQKQVELSTRMSAGVAGMGGLGLGCLLRTSPANSAEAAPSQAQLRNSLDRLNEALELATELKDKANMAKLNGRIGAVKYLMNLKGEAAEHVDTQLSLARKAGDRVGEALALRTLADVAELENGVRASLDNLKQYYGATLGGGPLLQLEADACKRLVAAYTTISNESGGGGNAGAAKLSAEELAQLDEEELAQREKDDIFLAANARQRALHFHKRYATLAREWFALPKPKIGGAATETTSGNEGAPVTISEEKEEKKNMDPIEMARLGLEVQKAANSPDRLPVV